MPFLAVALALVVVPIVLAALTVDTIRAARRIGGVSYSPVYSAYGA